MPGRESNKKSPQSPSDHGLRCPHQQYTGVLLQKRVCIIYFIRSNDSFVKPFSVFLALLVLLSAMHSPDRNDPGKPAERQLKDSECLVLTFFQKANGNVGLGIRQKPGICPTSC